jgi:hypothetical protein
MKLYKPFYGLNLKYSPKVPGIIGPLRGGPSRRKLGHQGHALGVDCWWATKIFFPLLHSNRIVAGKISGQLHYTSQALLVVRFGYMTRFQPIK